MGRFCGRMAAILVVPIPSVLLPLAKKRGAATGRSDARRHITGRKLRGETRERVESAR